MRAERRVGAGVRAPDHYAQFIEELAGIGSGTIDVSPISNRFDKRVIFVHERRNLIQDMVQHILEQLSRKTMYPMMWVAFQGGPVFAGKIITDRTFHMNRTSEDAGFKQLAQ